MVGQCHNLYHIDNFDINNIPIDNKYGYFLAVDLIYPYRLHDLPFCPSNCLASKEDKVKKLIADLGNKKNYVIHYRNLQQYIQNGLVLKKINRGVQFLQKPWLKNYTDLNTLHRRNAKNKFEKDFFKLMNNSVILELYGY